MSKLNTTPRVGINDPVLQRELREHAAQVNAMAEGRMAAFYQATTAAPTTGSWAQGDFVKNSQPSGASPVIGWVCTASGTPGTWVAVSSGGGGGALTTANAKLAANVALENVSAWYDGPSVTLAAGTWLVSGHASFVRNATVGTHWYLRITDGTNHYSSGQMWEPSASGNTAAIHLSTIATLASSTTIKLQATSSAGSLSNLMLAATAQNSSGNNATQISAVKVA